MVVLLYSTALLILAVVCSIVIQRHFFRSFATNYVAMAVGVVLALFPLTNQRVATFDSEIFMAAIVAPLLFFEG